MSANILTNGCTAVNGLSVENIISFVNVKINLITSDPQFFFKEKPFNAGEFIISRLIEDKTFVYSDDKKTLLYNFSRENLELVLEGIIDEEYNNYFQISHMGKRTYDEQNNFDDLHKASEYAFHEYFSECVGYNTDIRRNGGLFVKYETLKLWHPRFYVFMDNTLRRVFKENNRVYNVDVLNTMIKNIAKNTQDYSLDTIYMYNYTSIKVYSKLRDIIHENIITYPISDYDLNVRVAQFVQDSIDQVDEHEHLETLLMQLTIENLPSFLQFSTSIGDIIKLNTSLLDEISLELNNIYRDMSC